MEMGAKPGGEELGGTQAPLSTHPDGWEVTGCGMDGAKAKALGGVFGVPCFPAPPTLKFQNDTRGRLGALGRDT